MKMIVRKHFNEVDFKELVIVIFAFSNSIMTTISLFIVRIVRNGKKSKHLRLVTVSSKIV